MGHPTNVKFGMPLASADGKFRSLALAVALAMGVVDAESVPLVVGGIDVEADWAARSGAAGVFYAENFSTVSNTSQMLARAHSVVNSSKLSFDTALKLSGNGSCRSTHLASDGANEAAGAYRISFAGPGVTNKSVIKHQFYAQFSVYMHHVWNEFQYVGQGNKVAIIQSPDGLFADGEIVIERTLNTRRGIRVYVTRLGSAYVLALDWPTGWPPSGGHQYTWNSMYDSGSPSTVTTDNQAKQRYGILQYGTDFVDSNVPSAVQFVSDGWTTITVYVDQVNHVFKLWAAPYGQQPQLIIGYMNFLSMGDVGTQDGIGTQIFTGIDFLPRAEDVENWPSEDTHQNVTEILCTDAANPPKFPGGFNLPFAGTATPTGYPPAGTTQYLDGN